MIFTDRTVIVQKGTSSINDSIILYRGDKEVEIRFTLNEGSPFRFGSGASPNIIEKTEAAYGQLIIKRPNDLPAVFSEIAPTNEGKIIFTITAEMIDEITEVGNYTFQIRLLDESRNSRATLPEVVNGIEIREPIATEDVTTTNEVGAATVGYAMTTAAAPEDAFDTQGNYNKTTWGTGDRITDAKLNKIEAGIDGVNKKVANAGGSGEVDLSGYVTKETGNASQITFSDGQTFQAKLDAGTLKGDKGDKGEQGIQGLAGANGQDGLTTAISVNGNTYNHVNGVITLPDYSVSAPGGLVTDEQIATAVGNYLRENPIDGSIDTVVETIPDNNLFDKNNLVRSFTKQDGSTVNGNFTNYIKLENGKKYVTNLNYTQFYFFDENKNYISEQTYIANPQTLDGNGGYVLIKLPNDYSKSLVLEGTDMGAYKPQHIKLRSSLEDNKWYGKKWLLIGDSISTDAVDLAKNGYGKLISRELGMTLTNVSISGKTMKDGYEWLDSLSDEFDLITVMLGTNNQGYNCGIGSLNDSYYQAGTYNSNNSFYAQTQLMIEKLMTKFPKSKIIFLTPIKRTGVGDTAQYNDENGYFKKVATTKEYRDVIIDCCNYYSIPYIDLYNCIDPRTEVNRKLYFVKADGSDGTHPNDLGHALFLAPVIKNGIIKECPYYFNDWTVVETYGDIVPSVSNLSINEGGTGTFTVSLSAAPTNDQVVSLSSNNTDITVSPSSLTFTSENYSTAQTVTISAVEDDDTTNDTATITLSSNKVANKTISITVADNDEPAVTPTTYTITNNLTNCTNSNNAVSVEENASYAGTLTANDGYILGTPVITMGDTDVTSTVYSGGNINITSVTGNVVITCSATASSSGGDEAVLLHSWSGTPVDFDDNGTTRKMLEDTVASLDLKPVITWTGSEAAASDNYSSDRHYDSSNFNIPNDISFTLKIKQYTRNSNYFDVATFESGAVNGFKVNSYIPQLSGRFSISIQSTNNLVYGDGTLLFKYVDSTGTEVSAEKNTNVLFNNGETHDITLTFNVDTKEVNLYQDTALVITRVIDFNLYFAGIYIVRLGQKSSVEGIELYKGIVTP